MQYCNYCRRMTAGKPMFCNHCGRSYDYKLCPSRHVNPRSAEVCSTCGSRELSTPQPPKSIFTSALLVALSVAPGVLLLVVSIGFLIGFVQMLVTNQQAMFQFMLAGLVLGGTWWLYMQLPGILRKAVGKLFGKGGGEHKGGGGHGH